MRGGSPPPGFMRARTGVGARASEEFLLECAHIAAYAINFESVQIFCIVAPLPRLPLSLSVSVSLFGISAFARITRMDLVSVESANVSADCVNNFILVRGRN